MVSISCKPLTRCDALNVTATLWFGSRPVWSVLPSNPLNPILATNGQDRIQRVKAAE